MKRVAAAMAMVLVAIVLVGQTAPALPKLEKFDARLNAIIAPGTAIEELARGLTWTEGPVWDRRGGSLLFTEVPSRSVMRLKPGSAPVVVLRPNGSLAIDAQGRLLQLQNDDRRLVRWESDGKLTVLADRYEGKRLNSPNDLAIRSNGDVYFTDPPLGLPQRFTDPARELAFSGVYRLNSQGNLTVLIRDLYAPNGIAFSPREDKLYVSNTLMPPVWMVYDMLPDGAATNGRVFHDPAKWAQRGPGAPDGLKVDRSGNVFSAAPGGIAIFSPAGARLGLINLGQRTGNCAFGDDGSSLYITSSGNIFRVRLKTRGY